MNGADLAVLVVPFLDGSSNRVEAGTDLEVVPSWVDPSVYTWMSSMAASVAAYCWSLDIYLETSVIAVGAGGGRLQVGSGLGG